MSKAVHQPEASPSFRTMKWLWVFLLPSAWDASSSQGYPSIKLIGTHFSTWVERGTVSVKCLVKNTKQIFPARTQTWTPWSRVECSNHEVTLPPNQYELISKITYWLTFREITVHFIGVISTVFGIIALPIQRNALDNDVIIETLKLVLDTFQCCDNKDKNIMWNFIDTITRTTVKRTNELH